MSLFQKQVVVVFFAALSVQLLAGSPCKYGEEPFQGESLFRGTDDGALKTGMWENVAEPWGWESYDFVLCERADGSMYVIETHYAVALGKLRDVPLEVVKAADLKGHYKDKSDLAIHVSVRTGNEAKIYDLFNDNKNLKLAFRIIKTPRLKPRLDVFRREIGHEVYHSRMVNIDEDIK